MEEESYHYQVIRRAIDLIDRADGRLTLDEIATSLGMSAAHFQRVFSKWVGVSPKKYQQHLSLGYAKTLLSENLTTVEAAHEAGLSSSGRLHDLFVTWEAMTPGEFATQASDMPIRYGWSQTPFGDTLTMATSRGICGMAFTGDETREETLADMQPRWPKARFIHDDSYTAPLCAAAINGGDTALHLIGAPFQIKVWEALLRIPSGKVTTYSHIAQAIDNPKAVRAVGTAVGRNPISWLIPCHRALRKSGGLGGYHWGLPVKRAMLAYEGLNSQA